MEKYVYNLHKISFKDIEDIDINQSKWNAIFNFLLERASKAYFWGFRLEFMDDNLKNNINLLVDNNFLLREDDYFKVAFKIKESSIVLARGLLKEVWNYYEYPSIFFLTEELSSKDFKRFFQARNYEDIFGFLEGMYIVYKSFEPDVLWIEKTMEMEFPD